MHLKVSTVFFMQLRVETHTNCIRFNCTIYLSRKVISGNTYLIPGAYAPFNQKVKFRMSQNLGKSIRTYTFTFYVLTQSFVKTYIFRGLYKKGKNKPREMHYLSTKFYLFYTGHIKKSVFLKRLCEHVGYKDVHATFLFEFFKKHVIIFYIHLK
jgi:hypothetical protein